MSTEDFSFWVSIFSAVISVVSLLIIVLIQLWSVRLRGVEYQIERNTLLLEQCFGPLTNYFKQATVIQEISTVSVENKTVSRYILHFYPGLLEKIERIWDRFNFEINRQCPNLGIEIQYIMFNAEGRRSNKDRLEKHYIDTPPNRFLSKGLKNDEREKRRSDREIEQALENWQGEIIDQINQTTDVIMKRLEKNLALREDRKKIFLHLFWPYSQK